MIELRILKSKTGYLKAKNYNSVYDYEIYLGVLDKVENYEEISKEEYLKLKEENEEYANRHKITKLNN